MEISCGGDMGPWINFCKRKYSSKYTVTVSVGVWECFSWNHRTAWIEEGPQRPSSFNSPATCGVTNHRTRLPGATSNLALNASRDGASTFSFCMCWWCHHAFQAFRSSLPLFPCSTTFMQIGSITETPHCSCSLPGVYLYSLHPEKIRIAKE